MKLGILTFCTDTGLGNQTRLLHRLLKPAKTMLIDLNAYNNMPLHLDWYPGADVKTNGFPTSDEIDNFLQGLDAVFFCETPLNYYLIERAQMLGIATICQYNFEFFDWLNRPHLRRPAIFAGPTLWNKDKLTAAGIQMELLPLPIDQSTLPQRTISQARHFFHIAGRPAIYDRNGTLDFIKAVRMLRRMPDMQFTIYCQQPTIEIKRLAASASIRVIEHIENYVDIYRDGDVMVLPRRYGGLCLPLNEAIGSGIPVLMPDIDPNNTWLPREWLVPVLPTKQQFMAHTTVDLYSVNVQILARRMEALYRQPELVAQMHDQAKTLASGLSWELLRLRYEEVIDMAIRKMQ